MAECGPAFELIAELEGDEGADGIVGGFGGDVDDAVDRVCAPQRGPGTTDDLDAFDIIHHDVVLAPLPAAEEGRVDGATVDQGQKFVGRDVVETAGAERDVALVDAANLHAGGEPDRFGQVERARAMDIRTGNRVARSGSPEEGLLFARGAGHPHVQQILQ